MTKTAKYPDIASNLLIGRDRRQALRGPRPDISAHTPIDLPRMRGFPVSPPSILFPRPPRSHSPRRGNDGARTPMTASLHDKHVLEYARTRKRRAALDKQTDQDRPSLLRPATVHASTFRVSSRDASP